MTRRRLWLVPLVLCSLVPRVRAEGSGQHVLALTGAGTWLTPGRDHVAVSREFPDPAASAEPETVRLVFVGFAAAPQIRVDTRQANGSALDSTGTLSLAAWPCPASEAADRCWATLPLRLTPDALDRAYAPLHERSLEADLGGELQAEAGGVVLGSWRVGAPHDPLFVGVERLSARLRVRILRVAHGGTPAVGGDTATAIQVARREVLASSKLWAQCGVDLQGPAGLDIQVVDPPPVQLLAIGCEQGLPASGGQVSLRVQGRPVRVPTHAEESPRVVAERLATALRRQGFSAELSPNQRIGSGVSGAIDVLVRGAQGRSVSISGDPDPARPLSSDATLAVCLGEVDLSNGLSHFVEDDAAAGTLEERALVKAFDDGDPSTIEVFIVPSFDQSGRIGESFIDDAGTGIQNTVIIDRAALRAGPRSYALAHELGHILLNVPGHPDDYGVDQATSLMDSDASDASVFGPRRLDLEDCARMLRESGPGARVPLLQPWPLPAIPVLPKAVRAATSGR